MPLREGVALVGRGPGRRVEIVDGLVLDGGTPLSGADLRSRLGPDAAIVLRLELSGQRRAEGALHGAASGCRDPAGRGPSGGRAGGAGSRACSVTSTGCGRAYALAVTGAATSSTSSGPYRRTGARLALGKSINVEADEEVTEAVIAVGGDIRIAGRVREEVVALGGDVELLPTAEVRGDITAIGGRVSIAPGARHAGAVHHATVRDWPGWRWPVLGWSWFDLGGTARWLTLAGTLTRVGLLAAAVSLVMLLARGRISRIGAAAAAAPFRAGVIGLGLQLLFVPALIVISLGLAITIVGLPFVALLVPLALVTMFIAMLMGFSSLAHALGAWAARHLGWQAPPAVWAAVLGLVLIVLPTLVSRLVGVAPEALRAVAFALLDDRDHRRVPRVDDRPRRRGHDRAGPVGDRTAADSGAVRRALLTPRPRGDDAVGATRPVPSVIPSTPGRRPRRRRCPRWRCARRG